MQHRKMTLCSKIPSDLKLVQCQINSYMGKSSNKDITEIFPYRNPGSHKKNKHHTKEAVYLIYNEKQLILSLPGFDIYTSFYKAVWKLEQHIAEAKICADRGIEPNLIRKDEIKFIL